MAKPALMAAPTMDKGHPKDRYYSHERRRLRRRQITRRIW
jgi:hypothetical protein